LSVTCMRKQEKKHQRMKSREEDLEVQSQQKKREIVIMKMMEKNKRIPCVSIVGKKVILTLTYTSLPSRERIK